MRQGLSRVARYLDYNDTRPITVLAHNFQGYDGYFIVDEYHKQHRIVDQLRNGGKLLQVTFDNIRFIDSLSSKCLSPPFPKPLASLN